MNGPRTIAPSSIFFPFNNDRPADIERERVVRLAGIATLEIGYLDGQPGHAVLRERPDLEPGDHGANVLDLTLSQSDELMAGPAEDRIEYGRFSTTCRDDAGLVNVEDECRIQPRECAWKPPELKSIFGSSGSTNRLLLLTANAARH